MSDQNTRKEKLKIIFATYPHEDTVYMTGDDKAFFNGEQAESHAQRLKDSTVNKYPRTLFNALVDNEEGTEGETGEVTGEDAVGSAGESTGESTGEEASPGAREDERTLLAARFEELAGRKPAANMKLENLQKAVAELENANN